MDPDPEFRPKLDPDPGLCYQFWKQLKYIFRGKNGLKNLFSKLEEHNWPQNTFLVSWVSKLGIFGLQSDLIPFASILSYFYLWGSVFRIRIRIYKVVEDGSNLDPDPYPQHCLNGSHWELLDWDRFFFICTEQFVTPDHRKQCYVLTLHGTFSNKELCDIRIAISSESVQHGADRCVGSRISCRPWNVRLAVSWW